MILALSCAAVFASVLLFALCVAAGRADEAAERIRERREAP